MLGWNRRHNTPPAAAGRPQRPTWPLAAAAAAPAAAELEDRARLNCNCGRPANYLALVHQIDNCEPRSEGECEDLTPEGDAIVLRCDVCLYVMTAQVHHDITRRIDALPDGARLSCQTCGRPIACLHDVLEAEKL